MFGGAPEHDLEAKVRARMLDDIRAMNEKLGPMDAVMVVGDIAGHGQSEEFALASEFLDEVCGIVHCPVERVVCVPGNHDINRESQDSLHDAARFFLRHTQPQELSDQTHRLLTEQRGADLLFSTLENYNEFAIQYGCSIGPSQITWTPKSFSLGDREILIYGITTCWVSDNSDSDVNDESRLVVGEFQCGQIGDDPKQFSLAMMHHPHGWLRDASIIEPWLNRAHVVLTGHEHASGIEPDAAGRRVTIASGAVNPNREESGWIPAYNVIEMSLAGEESKTLRLAVHVRSWQANHGPTTVAQFGPDSRFDDPYVVDIHLESMGDEESEASPPPVLNAPVPAPTPEPIDSDLRRIVLRIMRASPDDRRRAARSLGILSPTETGGLAVDKMILNRALERDLLTELERLIRNG